MPTYTILRIDRTPYSPPAFPGETAPLEMMVVKFFPILAGGFFPNTPKEYLSVNAENEADAFSWARNRCPYLGRNIAIQESGEFFHNRAAPRMGRKV